MTGGLAQVADFKDGLFGPASAPESNINAVFGSGPGSPLQNIYTAMPGDAGFPLGLPTAETDWTGTTSSPVTPDDRAARYMPWMALGGTSVHIPVQLLQIVAVTEVLGQQRVLPPGQLSANMLSQAKTLCLSLLGPLKGLDPFSIWKLGQGYLDQSSINPSLLFQNGDAELWLRLCAIANPPPVHVLRMASPNSDRAGDLVVTAALDASYLQFDTQQNSNGGAASALVDSSLYPANTPVGNDQGGLDPCLVLPTADGVGDAPPCKTTSSTGNLWPWCVDPTSDATFDGVTAPVPSDLVPYECPPEVYKASQNCSLIPPIEPNGTTCFGNDRANRWAVRGAINAGMSVFHYVQSIETSGPASDYNACPTADWEPK
jgi:hypothetical protein